MPDETIGFLNQARKVVKKKGILWFLRALLALLTIAIFPRKRVNIKDYYEMDATLSGSTSTARGLYEMILKNDNSECNILVDIGCGYGENLSLCKDPVLAIGIDISMYRAYEIKKHGEAVVADAQYLPLRGRAVDKVIASEVLEHLKEPLKCLIDISYILKDDGHLCISAPNEYAYKLRRLTKLSSILRLAYLRYKQLHLHDLSLPNLTCLLRSAELKIDSISEVTDSWRLFGLFKRHDVFHWHLMCSKRL